MQKENLKFEPIYENFYIPLFNIKLKTKNIELFKQFGVEEKSYNELFFSNDYQSTIGGNISCNAFIDKSIILKPPFIVGIHLNEKIDFPFILSYVTQVDLIQRSVEKNT